MNLFVPGRICLLGEHSDWAGGYRSTHPGLEKGYAIIAGTNQGIHAEAEAHPSALVLLATTPDGALHGPHEIPMQPDALLREARAGGFWSYVAGVAYRILLRYGTGGLVLHNGRTDLPVRKGLSSSAAISVLTARAFNQVYRLGLDVREEMEFAYQGEVTTPSRCGRMDQGCAFGSRATLLTFDGDRLDTADVAVGADLHLVLVDLRAQKDTVRILARLHRAFPKAETAIDRGVQHLLGPINRRLVHEAVDAMNAGNAEWLGALMSEAQAAFDLYAAPVCPEELTAPILHRVLEHGPLRGLTWGGKGVGSQGDGAAQFVARGREARRAAIGIIERDLGMPCLELTLRGAVPREIGR